MRRLLPARWLTALTPESSTRFELPTEVVRDSRERVRITAAIGAAAYTLFLGLEATSVLGGAPSERRIDLIHDALGIFLCASVLALASLRGLRDRTVLRVAMVAEVLLCALISVAVLWAGYLRTQHLATLTWVVPIIILFPLLVPLRPRTALGLSILCASTVPLGLLALALSGRVTAHWGDFIGLVVSGAVAVGIGWISSRVVYGAHRQMAAARRVGSYELLERLSQGGMGEVWKARHQFLARPAAVKLILPEQLQGDAEARENVLQRFTREAQVTALLRSPHTVELFDFGISDDGSLYYAMELLEGINVEHFVYHYGPVEPRRAAQWLQQACHSLAEAHARELVHRDIKPSNLFVCRYGLDDDFIKVLDFGLTRPLGRTDPRLTSANAVLGTPGYMAPEQIFGQDAGPRTDLYALGCVAYWLVAGVKPFEGKTSGDLMRSHALDVPLPPSQRSGLAIPQRFEALIMSCLSKAVEDRPIDAEGLRRDLETCFDGHPWSARDAQEWWVAKGPRPQPSAARI